MTTKIELISEHACFGGVQRFYQHHSAEIGLPMKFSVFLPPQATAGKVPALMYLAGLTCNEETFMTKAGAQRLSKHYRMESYLTAELLPLLTDQLPLDAARIGIFGHSMGGHGALTLALRHPGLFKSVSALAPICAPGQCDWGRKAFSGYLGANEADWRAHDASALMAGMKSAPYPGGILVDQGLADKFLAPQLHPHLFEAACASARQPLQLRRHTGYDHGYYFIATFMADHLQHHARQLGLSASA